MVAACLSSGCFDGRVPGKSGDDSTTQAETTQGSSSHARGREIWVSVDSDGSYTVDGQSCDVDLLEGTLRELTGEGGSSCVRILCGSDSEFELVQQVIDPVMRLQMWDVTLQALPDQEPVNCSRTCAGPWDRPVLHVRVFPKGVTVNGADSSLASLDALLRGNSEKYVVFVRPQEGASVGEVYRAFRTCEANAVEFGLVEEEGQSSLTAGPGDIFIDTRAMASGQSIRCGFEAEVIRVGPCRATSRGYAIDDNPRWVIELEVLSHGQKMPFQSGRRECYVADAQAVFGVPPEGVSGVYRFFYTWNIDVPGKPQFEGFRAEKK